MEEDRKLSTGTAIPSQFLDTLPSPLKPSSVYRRGPSVGFSSSRSSSIPETSGILWNCHVSSYRSAPCAGHSRTKRGNRSGRLAEWIEISSGSTVRPPAASRAGTRGPWSSVDSTACASVRRTVVRAGTTNRQVVVVCWRNFLLGGSNPVEEIRAITTETKKNASTKTYLMKLSKRQTSNV